MPTIVSLAELDAELDSVVLIEALPAVQYAAGHIPGALLAPEPLSAAAAAVLIPALDTRVVVYCSGPACRRSTVAARTLEQVGYTNVSVYSGGKVDWLDSGRPFEFGMSGGELAAA